MAVEHLEQARPLQLQQFVRRDRPAEVRMVDARHGACAPRMASIIFCTMSSTELPPGGLMNDVGLEAVDVIGLSPNRSVTSSPFITRNLSSAPCSGVEAVDARQVVVIGERDEVVAVLAIPPHHIVGRRIAVAVQRVRVKVALEPELGGLGLAWRVATATLTASQRNGRRSAHEPVSHDSDDVAKSHADRSLHHRLDARIIPHHRDFRAASVKSRCT